MGIKYACKAAVYGDSITEQNNSQSVTGLNNESKGYLSTLKFLMGQPFYYPVAGNSTHFIDGNFGVGGDDSAQAYARISDVLTYDPDICFVQIGANDLVNVARSYNDIITTLGSIYADLLAAGIFVVAITILPRSYWDTLSAPDIVIRRNIQNQVNQWILSYAARTGAENFIAVDPAKYLIDATSANGDPIAAYFQDGLHPGPKGAYYLALSIKEKIGHLFQGGGNRFFSQSDLYDATNNPYGNLVVNGLLTGTAGSKGSGITGSVATSHTVTRTGQLTAVGSKNATALDGTPGTSQRLVISANGLGTGEETVVMRLSTALAAGFVAGDVIEAGAECAISGLSGNFLGCSLNAQCVAGSTYTNTDMDRHQSPDFAHNLDVSGIFLTPRFVIPASPTSLTYNLQMRFYNTVAGGGTFDFGRVWMRKVVP